MSKNTEILMYLHKETDFPTYNSMFDRYRDVLELFVFVILGTLIKVQFPQHHFTCTKKISAKPYNWLLNKIPEIFYSIAYLKNYDKRR